MNQLKQLQTFGDMFAEGIQLARKNTNETQYHSTNEQWKSRTHLGATGNWNVTLELDIFLEENWLLILDDFLEEKVVGERSIELLAIPRKSEDIS